MEALREIRTRDKRLSLSVVSTVMSSNIEDIKRLLNLGVTEWDLDYHSLNILRGKWMDATLSAPTPEQYAEVSKLQLQLCRRYFHGRWGASADGPPRWAASC